jgi:hypothetical protein
LLVGFLLLSLTAAEVPVSTMSGVPWLWLAVAGLGLFHGVNPAMGWLFAAGLGLNRNSERAVWLSLIPIALGHALAVGLVLVAVLALGFIVEPVPLQRLAAIVLIGWGGWHAFYGRRHKLRVGMRTGLAGLFLWSFLMANAHGAGLMLIPAVIPLCLAAAPAHELTAGGSAPIALLALGLHTAAMLAAIAAISIIVYKWVGVAFLRRGWVNLDLLWAIALMACGVILLLA